MNKIITCCIILHRIEYQLPNLIVGAITKESLYNAFENGITAEQVREHSYTILPVKSIL